MTATSAGRFEQLRAALLDRASCPACGSPLTGPHCGWCGVRLDGPAAREVLRLSMAAAGALSAREAGVRALYAERDARLGPAPNRELSRAQTRASSPMAPRSASQHPVTTRHAPARPPAHTMSPGTARPPSTSAPHWKVQSVLQVLGAGLISAAGIVFLVFSWGVLDLRLRAALVGAGTVVVFVLASLLARRGLRQGAEAVGTIAAVLLLLDGWALRRTGVVTLGEPGVYASCVALVCAALLLWWGRSSRLRVGTVAAAVLLLLAPVPLATVRPSAAALCFALLGSVAASWVRHVPAVTKPADTDSALRVSRTVLTTGAVLAWSVAALVGLAQLRAAPDDTVTLLAAAAAVAVVQRRLSCDSAGHSGRPLERHWSTAGATAALLAATIAAGLTSLGNGAAIALLLAGCAAGIVAMTEGPSPKTPATPRPVPARSLTGLLLDDPVATLAPAAALLIATGGGALLPSGHATVAVLLTVAACAGLLERRWTHVRPLAAPAVAARVTMVAAVLVALVGARASTFATAVALAACAAVSVTGRRWGRGDALAAVSTAVAAPWAVTAIGMLALAAGAPLGAAVAIAGAAGASLLGLVVVAPVRSRSERTVALAAAACSAGGGWALTALVPQWWGVPSLLAVTAACLIALLALVADDDRVGADAAVVASAGAAPVLALAVVSAAVVLRPAHVATGAVLVIAAVGTSTVLLAVLARDHRSPAAGHAATLGGWITLAGALIGAAARSAELTATVLLLASAAALGVGLRDREPALRWGALALATASSWTLLAADHPSSPEAFTAPTAIVVAIVGARRLWHGRPEGAALLGSGLTLMLLPTALLRGYIPLPAGLELDRRVLTTAAAVILTLLACRRMPRRTPPVTTVLAGLGLALTVLGPLRAAVDAAGSPRSSVLPELLGGLGAVLLAVGCRATGGAAPAAVGGTVRVIAPWAVTAAGVLPSVLAAAPGAAGQVRAAVLAVIGTALTLTGAGRHIGACDPWHRNLMGVGVLASAGAAIAATRALPTAPAGVVPALLGLLLVTTLLLRPPQWTRPADLVRAAAAFLLLGLLLAARSEPWRPTAWTGTAVALLVAAWSTRHRAGSTSGVRLVAGAAAGTAVLGPWWYAVAHLLPAGSSTSPGPERWTVPAALVVAAACTISWPRRDGLPTRLALTMPAAVVAAVPTLLAARGTVPGVVRLVAVLLAGVSLAVVGQERWFDGRPPAAVDDARRTFATGVAIAAAAALAAVFTGPWPADVPVLVLGVLLTALGVRRADRDPSVNSWRALGAGLTCALVVPAVVSTANPAGWRPVVVMLLALAATVAGAVRRWQAPFLTGAAVLVVVTALQVGPLAGRVLVHTHGWLLLALCGTLLLALGLRYERRLAQAREAVRFVNAMR